MADNVQLSVRDGDGEKIVTAEITFSGDTANVQGEFPGILSGSAESYAFTLIVGGAGAVTGGVQRMTLASDDPAVALLTTIDVDTSKIPSLGTATMTGAAPVTLATDDTLTAAANVLLGTIDADTSKIPSLGTAAMAAAAPVTIATNDTQFGAVGAASDVDGNVHGQLRYIGENIDEVHIAVDDLDATASWANSTDASGITQSTDNVPTHTIITSLSIDKDGVTETEGSYGKTLGTTVDASVLAGDAVISYYVRHGNYTNVSAVFVRLGADASNYMEYAFDPADFSTSLWTHVTIPLHEGSQTGTGLDLANIDYVAFGVTMGAAGNTISSIFFNAIELHSVSGVELLLTSDVTASTVRISKMGSNANNNVAMGTGTDSTGVQRMSLATNVALPAGTNAIGKLAANNGVDIGDVDVTSVVPGVAATSLGKAEDAQHTSGDVGVESLAVRNDDLAALAAHDNDYAPLQVDTNGALYVNQGAAEPKCASGVAAGGTPGADVMIAAVGSRYLLITALTLIPTSTTTNSVFVDNVDNMLLGDVTNPIELSLDADGDTLGGLVLPYNPAGWFKTDTVNEAVTLNTDTAEDIIWSISYVETL